MKQITSENGVKYRTPRVMFSMEEAAYWSTRLTAQQGQAGTYPVLWDMVRQFGLQLIGGAWDVDKQTGNAPNSAVTQRRAILADSQFVALELWAITGYIAYYYEIDGSNKGNRAIDNFAYMTYDQPSAIAGNSTTPAIQTQNYGLRNSFWGSDAPISAAVQSDTAVATYFLGGLQSLLTLDAFWQEPLRIVGPNIELNIHNEVEDGTTTGDTWTYNYTINILGRYVEIGVDEYSRLAALATGQAVLPQPIVS